MRVLAAILGAGRASRLHRRLVEETRSSAFVSVEMTETLGAGAMLVAAEVIPEVEHKIVERLLVEELDRASRGGFEESELERAKSVLIADWVLGHEQAQEIALTVASAGALMDVGLTARHLERIRICTMDEVENVAARHLNEASRRVVGWSLPERGRD
jgi:zinc protease